MRCPPRLLRGYSWIAKRARTRSLTSVPRGWKGPIVARRRPVVCSARPATRGRPKARVFAVCVHAGVTWTSRTASAGWGARFDHTSVVDAVSGAIYVLGGIGGSTYNDVWVGTDRGARAGLSQGYCAVLGFSSRAFEGAGGAIGCTHGIPAGTQEALNGYGEGGTRGTHGVEGLPGDYMRVAGYSFGAKLRSGVLKWYSETPKRTRARANTSTRKCADGLIGLQVHTRTQTKTCAHGHAHTCAAMAARTALSPSHSLALSGKRAKCLLTHMALTHPRMPTRALTHTRDSDLCTPMSLVFLCGLGSMCTYRHLSVSFSRFNVRLYARGLTHTH
jgi:hypothetical protein